ncbi:unnamed protein product [Amoebophrya sp. A25]|nr:unnamed protein product [Amoebophrya sp. A25]|eukprot:GSA25T00024831001.1
MIRGCRKPRGGKKTLGFQEDIIGEQIETPSGGGTFANTSPSAKKPGSEESSLLKGLTSVTWTLGYDKRTGKEKVIWDLGENFQMGSIAEGSTLLKDSAVVNKVKSSGSRDSPAKIEESGGKQEDGKIFAGRKGKSPVLENDGPPQEDGNDELGADEIVRKTLLKGENENIVAGIGIIGRPTTSTSSKTKVPAPRTSDNLGSTPDNGVGVNKVIRTQSSEQVLAESRRRDLSPTRERTVKSSKEHAETTGVDVSQIELREQLELVPYQTDLATGTATSSSSLMEKPPFCFRESSRVDYWSSTHGAYIPATITGFDLPTCSATLALRGKTERRNVPLSHLAAPLRAGDIAEFYHGKRWFGPCRVAQRCGGKLHGYLLETIAPADREDIAASSPSKSRAELQSSSRRKRKEEQFSVREYHLARRIFTEHEQVVVYTFSYSSLPEISATVVGGGLSSPKINRSASEFPITDVIFSASSKKNLSSTSTSRLTARATKEVGKIVQIDHRTASVRWSRAADRAVAELRQRPPAMSEALQASLRTRQADRLAERLADGGDKKSSPSKRFVTKLSASSLGAPEQEDDDAASLDADELADRTSNDVGMNETGQNLDLPSSDDLPGREHSQRGPRLLIRTTGGQERWVDPGIERNIVVLPLQLAEYPDEEGLEVVVEELASP